MLPEIVKEWIQKADEDYGFALSSIECNEYFGPICFHFQQAAEKYLKAVIIANELDFRPVHNLIELLTICKKASPDILELEQACRFLNPFYIDTRYPVHWPTEYNRITALKAEQMTSVIKNWVTNFLSS
jgi:HEPN domain-containing protein